MKYKRNRQSSKYTSSAALRKSKKKSVLSKIPSYVIFITLILFCILKLSEKGCITLRTAIKDTKAEAVFEKLEKFSDNIESYMSIAGQKGAEFVSGYLKSDNDDKEKEKVFAQNAEKETSENSSDVNLDTKTEDDAFTPSLPCQGEISSPFGEREHPISGQGNFHNGIDIAVDAGTEIRAIEDGEIKKSTYNQYSGNFVVINHSDGYSSSYAHLGESYVSEGQKVKKGDIIGLAGSTGISTGPHLHMEIRKDDVPLDPMELIEV